MALSILVVSGVANAARYEVVLTIVSDNFYRVEGKHIYVLTHDCDVYALSERAAMSEDSIRFQTHGICFVAAILVQGDVSPGKYRVVATRKTRKLYFVGRDTYALTSLCHVNANRMDAVLSWSYDSGIITFANPKKTRCTVKSILIPMRRF